MGLTPAAFLYATASEAIKYVVDGSDYLLGVASKLRNVAGTIVNPATEDKQDDGITKLGTIDGVLDSIKDTDGIKKIVDALPVGDNWLGKVKIGDGTYLAEIVQDDEGTYRFAVDARSVAGSSVVIGAPFPEAPGDIYDVMVEKSGGGFDLRVDGSTTPVAFTADADAARDVRLYEIRVVFSSDDFIVDGNSFGPNLSLTNGIEIKLTVNDGTDYVLKTIKYNKDFLKFFGSVIGSNTVINNAGPKDAIVSTFALGGLMRLKAGTSDNVTVTISDDLTSSKFKVLEIAVYGVKV